MFGADFRDQLTLYATLIDLKDNQFEVLVERINGAVLFFQKVGRRCVSFTTFIWVRG